MVLFESVWFQTFFQIEDFSKDLNRQLSNEKHWKILNVVHFQDRVVAAPLSLIVRKAGQDSESCWAYAKIRNPTKLRRFMSFSPFDYKGYFDKQHPNIAGLKCLRNFGNSSNLSWQVT